MLLDHASDRSNKTFAGIARNLETDCIWIDTYESDIAATMQVAIKRLLPAMSIDQRKDLQVLAPVHMGNSGTVNLNRNLQELLNPPSRHKAELQRGQNTFRVGDRVIQTENNYDSQVFNGDMGYIVSVDSKNKKLTVEFPPIARIRNNTRKISAKHHQVEYMGASIRELEPAWAITVHKAQGSEYPAVIIPVAFAHKPLLNRRLLYTALSRARHTAILVGPRAAIQSAVQEIGETRLTDLDEQWYRSVRTAKKLDKSSLVTVDLIEKTLSAVDSREGRINKSESVT